MKGIVFISLVCTLISFRSFERADLAGNSTLQKGIDTSKIAIIPFDKESEFLFANSKAADLTENDLNKIELLLNKSVKAYNKRGKFGRIVLRKYKRQYVAVINKNGEKEVWVNCFCQNSPDWKSRLYIVKDGGTCFFNVRINLTKETYYDLFVNGI